MTEQQLKRQFEANEAVQLGITEIRCYPCRPLDFFLYFVFNGYKFCSHHIVPLHALAPFSILTS